MPSGNETFGRIRFPDRLRYPSGGRAHEIRMLSEFARGAEGLKLIEGSLRTRFGSLDQTVQAAVLGVEREDAGAERRKRENENAEIQESHDQTTLSSRTIHR